MIQTHAMLNAETLSCLQIAVFADHLYHLRSLRSEETRKECMKCGQWWRRIWIWKVAVRNFSHRDISVCSENVKKKIKARIIRSACKPSLLSVLDPDSCYWDPITSIWRNSPVHVKEACPCLAPCLTSRHYQCF